MKLIDIKNHRTLLLAGTAALVFASCSLEEIPRDKQVQGSYNSPREAEQAVMGAYSRLRPLANTIYLHLSEVRSDNTWVLPQPNGYREYSEIGTFRADYSETYTRVGWKELYEVIYATNAFLEKVDDVEFINDTDQKSLKDQLWGEAHFLRGWAYFELARLYGNVPLITETLLPEVVKSVKQSPMSEVYNERVLPDLLVAEEYLPMPGDIIRYDYEADNARGRADKVACKAMLARVYMQMAGFPLNDNTAQARAKTKLEEVLAYQNNYWADDIKEWRYQFTMEGNNKNSIFAIQYTAGGYGNTAIFNFSKAVPTSYTKWRIFGNDIFVEKTLQYQYTVDWSTGNKDLRGFDWTVLNTYEAEGTSWPDPYSNSIEQNVDYGDGPYDIYTQSIWYKFLDSRRKRAELDLNPTASEDDMVDYDDWPINQPILRIEDMMLLYAEILTSEGDWQNAINNYVNPIRQRAGIDPVTPADQAGALAAIKMERRLELAGEGVRWFDEVRYGEWQTATIDLFNRYGNPVGTDVNNVRDGRYLYPIPLTEMNSFEGLYTQNEGY